MSAGGQPKLNDGDQCSVIRGTHAGKSGILRDIKTSKTGHVTVTVVQKNGERFKTLARNALSSQERPEWLSALGSLLDWRGRNRPGSGI